MSDEVLDATLALRSFLFEAVYENEVATAEFGKAEGILGGLWEKVRAAARGVPRPADRRAEGLDVAAQDFVAGMTDRYAVSLFERLFIPKPWVEIAPDRVHGVRPDVTSALAYNGGSVLGDVRHHDLELRTFGSRKRRSSAVRAVGLCGAVDEDYRVSRAR